MTQFGDKQRAGEKVSCGVSVSVPGECYETCEFMRAKQLSAHTRTHAGSRKRRIDERIHLLFICASFALSLQLLQATLRAQAQLLSHSYRARGVKAAGNLFCTVRVEF